MLFFLKESVFIMANSVDIKTINKLADLLNKQALEELEYEDETCRIRLKGACTTAITAPAMVASSVCTQTSNISSSDDKFAIDDYSNNAGSVKSPIVGVVYLSPDPTKPDYVAVGDSVKEGDIVCLIEAMKTFNPVKAHRSGVVTKILVESGDPVEYGASLMVIE